MSAIASAIKEEIVRLSRKELKHHIEPVKKASAGLRRDVAALKRRVADLERENGSLRKRLPGPAPLVVKDMAQTKIRFVPKGIPALRKRLGITVEQLATILDCSTASIYNWQAGPTVPQRAQLEKLAALRGMSRDEAMQRLSMNTVTSW